MRILTLAAGAAALALALPVAAHNHNGKGGGKPDRGGQAKAERGGGPSAKAQGQDNRPDRAERQAKQVEPGRGRPESPRVARTDDRPGKAPKGGDARVVRLDDGNDVRLVRRNLDGDGLRGVRTAFDCPPGLDRKDNGCLPPGQAMKLVGAPLVSAFSQSLLPVPYRRWYPDSDEYYYRSGDGFIYRVNRSNNLVDGLIPLFGSGYYTPGDPWPQPYNFYNVPAQYRSYWSDGDDYLYRYGDGAIYRLDPTTQAVNAIVALLAGDLGVGSRLPAGYDVYNVPLAYRAQYSDTADNWYRYNDGYIYRVDPTTRLITAVIDAIV